MMLSVLTLFSAVSVCLQDVTKIVKMFVAGSQGNGSGCRLGRGDSCLQADQRTDRFWVPFSAVQKVLG